MEVKSNSTSAVKYCVDLIASVKHLLNWCVTLLQWDDRSHSSESKSTSPSVTSSENLLSDVKHRITTRRGTVTCIFIEVVVTNKCYCRHLSCIDHAAIICATFVTNISKEESCSI